MKTFAERLKHYMEQANMKQTDLVEKTKINKSSISEYLSGNYEPKQRNIYKIATALGIKPSQLMGISNTSEPPAPTIKLTAQEEEHIKKYRQLNADGKSRVDYVLNMEFDLVNNSAEKEERSLG
ncbi:helix-turn-helix domain-containing protein [Phascolarctobacterium succinatutens]|uniref:helix-turn-helix domain-containing protein n=1 Tax=Phascolarctobacterium succinatutens TaxID=626940 RepID=UPI003D07596A